MRKIFALPIHSDRFNHKYRVILDGVICVYQLKYNTRLDRWFISFYDDADNLLVGGLKVKMGSFLLQQTKHIPGLPPGEFAVLNYEKDEEMNKENAGTQTELVYISYD